MCSPVDDPSAHSRGLVSFSQVRCVIRFPLLCHVQTAAQQCCTHQREVLTSLTHMTLYILVMSNEFHTGVMHQLGSPQKDALYMANDKSWCEVEQVVQCCCHIQQEWLCIHVNWMEDE